MTNTNISLETPANLYAELVRERFNLPVSLLRNTSDGKMAYAPCVVLSTMETYECKKLAYRDTLKAFEGKAPKNDEVGVWNTLYEDNLGAYTIFYSVRVPDNLKTKLFISKDQIMNDYTPAEIGILYSNYLTVVLNQPHIKHLQEGDVAGFNNLLDTIIRQATVEETSFFLSSYTTVSVATLVRSLVETVMILQKQNGASGSLSNDTTATESTRS